MGNLMERLYDDLVDAKAFMLSFTNFVHTYDDKWSGNFESVPCEVCGKTTQITDYLVPKANCKKPYGILSSYEFGVSQNLRRELIEQFDVTEDDFRPIRNKTGDIVYYQITPTHTMLPINAENNWMPHPPCPLCGSIQYEDSEFENDKGEPFYYISQEALTDMHDFNVTYEKFSRFYMPKYVISNRVYNYLVERFPRTHYFPFYLKK